jgi:hypothetical protein
MRPEVPESLREPGELFGPAPEVRDWIFATFFNPKSIFLNEAHEHLLDAQIGVLWTNMPRMKGGKDIAGTAELPSLQGNAWTRGRQIVQLKQWFGELPDFIITLYGPYFHETDDASFCAGVEHEIYHCGQAIDQYGSPRFTREGKPVFAIISHTAEEFDGIVARYGVGAAASGVASLVAAAGRKPLISGRAIKTLCGTCS